MLPLCLLPCSTIKRWRCPVLYWHFFASLRWLPLYPLRSSFFFCTMTADGEKQSLSSPHIYVFRTRRVSSQLHCVRNPAVADASFSSRGSDSVSCPYWRSPVLLHRRKLPCCQSLQKHSHPPVCGTCYRGVISRAACKDDESTSFLQSHSQCVLQ